MGTKPESSDPGKSSVEMRDIKTLNEVVDGISTMLNKEHVFNMMNLQVTAIDRLECTNKSLNNCISMAQDKLSSTSKLFKRTSKQIHESKKDLDVIYRKISDLKAKLRHNRPDLFRDIDRDECHEGEEIRSSVSNDTKGTENLD